MDRKGIWWDGADWIGLWRALVNTAMNIRVPQNVENLLTEEDEVLKQDCSTQLVS